MTQQYRLMIPQAKPSNQFLDVLAPYDQSLIAQVEVADQATIELALQQATDCFTDQSQWLARHQRIAILERSIEIIKQQQADLALASAREGGKPLVDSLVEIERAIDGLKNCIECIRSQHGSEIPMGITAVSDKHTAFTSLEPIGVVVALSAFNHPFNLIVHQAGPVIAAGCPVIIKPAQDTPIMCIKLVEIFYQAGLPREWCQVVVSNDNQLAQTLATDSRVAFLSFIGSANVGWMLRSKLAPGTRCALEHGGVAPVIVEADADLDQALKLISKAGFYHAGQVCVSVQRIYCHESIAKDFAEKLASIAEKLVVGDPTQATTEVGPLIRPREVQRVDQWVSAAIAEGAQALCGATAIGETGYAPTVLFEPSDQSQVSTQEIFAPVVCVYSYSNREDAIQRANALPFAFQAAVFTKNINTMLQCYRQLNASAVMVNTHTAFRVDWMPFAGLKQSGLGVGGIPHTYRDMQIEKMLLIHG